MLKEAELLEVLRQANADIELILLKDMLDNQFTVAKEGNYAKPYAETTEEKKWLFAKKITENLRRNILFWDNYLDSMDFQEAYTEFFWSRLITALFLCSEIVSINHLISPTECPALQ